MEMLMVLFHKEQLSCSWGRVLGLKPGTGCSRDDDCVGHHPVVW